MVGEVVGSDTQLLVASSRGLRRTAFWRAPRLGMDDPRDARWSRRSPRLDTHGGRPLASRDCRQDAELGERATSGSAEPAVATRGEWFDPIPFEADSASARKRWTDAASDALDAGTLLANLKRVDGVLVSLVTGKCPRCGDYIDDRQVLTAVGEGIKATSKTQAESSYVTVIVTCGCAEHHPTPPPKVRGCGISFGLELERP